MSSSTRLLSGKFSVKKNIRFEVGEFYFNSNITESLNKSEYSEHVGAIVAAYELHGWKFLGKEWPPIGQYVEVIASDAKKVRSRGVAKLKNTDKPRVEIDDWYVNYWKYLDKKETVIKLTL